MGLSVSSDSPWHARSAGNPSLVTGTTTRFSKECQLPSPKQPLPYIVRERSVSE